MDNSADKEITSLKKEIASLKKETIQEKQVRELKEIFWLIKKGKRR